MKQLKRIARRLAAQYDVLAHHAYSRQSVDAHEREFPLTTATATGTSRLKAPSICQLLTSG